MAEQKGRRKTTSQAKKGSTKRKSSGQTSTSQRTYGGRSGRTSSARSGKAVSYAGKSRGRAAGHKAGRTRDDYVRRDVTLIVFLVISVLIFLGCLGIGGVVGRAVGTFFFGMFGLPAYLFPFLLFYLALFLSANTFSGGSAARVTGLLGVYVFLCGFFHLVIYGVEESSARDLYLESAMDKSGGGLIGGVLADFLGKAFGTPGAYVIVICALILFAILLTQKPLLTFVRKQGEYMYDTRPERVARREEKRYLRRQRQEELRARRDRENAIRENRRKRSAEARAAAETVRRVDPQTIRADGDITSVHGEGIDPIFTGSPEYGTAGHGGNASSFGAGQKTAKGRRSGSAPGMGRSASGMRNAAKAADMTGTASYDEDIIVNNRTSGSDAGAKNSLSSEENAGAGSRPVRPEDIPDSIISNSASRRYAEAEVSSEPAKEALTAAVREPAEEFIGTGKVTSEETTSSDAAAAGRSSDGLHPIEESMNKAAESVRPAHRDSEDLRSSGVHSSGDAGTGSAEDASQPADTGNGEAPEQKYARKGKPSIVKAEEIQVPEQKELKKYEFPPLSLLNPPSSDQMGDSNAYLKKTAAKLQETLHTFGVEVTINHISCGPSVTRFELTPQMGVKVSKILSLQDDIKLNLAAADIRIEAPIPGKSAIGIEVPNKRKTTVNLRELLETDAFRKHKSKLAFAVGKDIAGQPVIADLAKMPHLLIAGATGSGKSVFINTLIMSLIYKSRPDEVKFIMVDPKVVELSVYNGIPHLLIPVVTDPKKAAGALNWAVNEMTDRYQKFAAMHVRDLSSYNAKIDAMPDPGDGTKPKKMYRLVVIVDELADLMMVAQNEVEDSICRLAQLARAAGIHLVIATQRPSVNVITGLIKANMPSRIALSVSSGVDSRTIIDMNGAEKLLGNGDMLFYPQGYQKPARVQGAFLSDDEISAVVHFLKDNAAGSGTNPLSEEIQNKIDSHTTMSTSPSGDVMDSDEYFTDAGKLIIEKDKASIGMLQRAFRIGFNRAARIMDQLCDAGVVSEEEGTKPRKVLMTMEQFENYLEENG